MSNKILPNQITQNKNGKQNFVPVGRTLPREIVKWIQGLDLSYSVKDAKRDLSNGFLIAEIFSRYYPGRVQMHSFDNSFNEQRRKNNWDQLQLFFTKNDIAIAPDQYQKILQESNWEELYNLIVNIFTILTQRKITNPPLATYINTKEFQSSATEGGTQSFLLKEKGLEPLNVPEHNKAILDQNQRDYGSEKQALLSVSSKRTNFIRVPSKPISQNIESLQYQIDVKSIQIRSVQGNIMKVRDQQQQQPAIQEIVSQDSQKLQIQPNLLQDSFQKSIQEQNLDKRDSTGTGTGTKEKALEKTIYEILNETLMMRMQLSQFQEDMKLFKVKNNTLVQAFIDQIEQFSDEFAGGFFKDIISQKEAFINFIFKDTNDLWKFFNFCFQCINNLSPIRESFRACIELIQQFGQKSLQKDSIKTRSIFTEFFLPQICQMLKDSILFEKKEMLIQVIYSFSPSDAGYRHQIIAAIKDLVKSQELFMQILTVLIRFETNSSDQQKLLFEDFIHYAMIHLFSQSPTLSSCALSIFAHIATINPILIHSRILPKIVQIAKNKWWQNRCLAIVLFSQLIQGVINSAQYQLLIKSPQSGQKFFSMENERLISDLKSQINQLSDGILIASQPASSDMLLTTTLIYIVELLGDSRSMLELFVKIILEVGQELRQWVLYGNTENQGDNYMYVVPSDRSFKYKTNINSKIIQQHAPTILLYLVSKNKLPSITQGQFQIIHYCFIHTDFKVMNMESCESAANLFKEYIYLGMCDGEICQDAAQLVKKLLELQFKAEVNVIGQDSLFSQMINLVFQQQESEVHQNLIQFLNVIIDDSLQAGSESLRGFLKIVYQNLQEMKSSPLQNKSITRCFERVISGAFEEANYPAQALEDANHQQIDEDMEISAVDKQQDQTLDDNQLEVEGDFGDEQNENNQYESYDEQQQQ